MKEKNYEKRDSRGDLINILHIINISIFRVLLDKVNSADTKTKQKIYKFKMISNDFMLMKV